MECAAIQPLVRRQPGSPRLAAIHAQSSEPVGAARLMPLAREMERTARFLTPRSLSIDRVIGQPALSGDMVTLTNTAVSLLLFGGKGGVGKTTCAAAAAVDLASSYPDRPVLLISTDPAHSLGDVLGVALGNDVRPVPGGPRNLHARELDAAAGFTAIKARYRDAIDGLFARLLPEGAISVEGDRRAFRDLLELAPPGLDELMAIVEVSDALYAADGSRLLVIDTAPTGHALRLLEMPTLVHDWVKALMRILLKYQSVTRAGDLGVLLVQMSRGLTRLRAVLVDPSRTAFVAVSRPGALPLAETERMIQRIRRLQIPIMSVLVNALGAGHCTRCRRARLEQDRTLRAVRRSRTLARYPLIVAPAVVPPPRGANELRDWRNMWRTERGGISSRAWNGRRAGGVKRK
jgi:arsenite-transporting ATPase